MDKTQWFIFYLSKNMIIGFSENDRSIVKEFILDIMLKILLETNIC